jgi:hypothetical protein
MRIKADIGEGSLRLRTNLLTSMTFKIWPLTHNEYDLELLMLFYYSLNAPHDGDSGSGTCPWGGKAELQVIS